LAQLPNKWRVIFKLYKNVRKKFAKSLATAISEIK